jgi:hypothetical protein
MSGRIPLQSANVPAMMRIILLTSTRRTS